MDTEFTNLKVSNIYDNLGNLKVLANQNSVTFNDKIIINGNPIESVGNGTNNTDALNKA